jgi:hypothetical protein
MTSRIVDGISGRIRPGQKRKPMLAWGFTTAGAKVLLHLVASSKEDFPSNPKTSP